MCDLSGSCVVAALYHSAPHAPARPPLFTKPLSLLPTSTQPFLIVYFADRVYDLHTHIALLLLSPSVLRSPSIVFLRPLATPLKRPAGTRVVQQHRRAPARLVVHAAGRRPLPTPVAAAAPSL